MKIKYAIIRAARLADVCCLLHRFEDEEDEIVLGTLPTQFQALLFGPSDWQVIRIFPADVT